LNSKLAESVHEVDRAVLRALRTVIEVVADATVPTVAPSVSCPVCWCGWSYPLLGLRLRLDKNPIFGNNHLCLLLWGPGRLLTNYNQSTFDRGIPETDHGKSELRVLEPLIERSAQIKIWSNARVKDLGSSGFRGTSE
jgi:hypothetical protein